MTTKQCKHGQFYYEACVECHDEEVDALKAELERRCACEFDESGKVALSWCSFHGGQRMRYEERIRGLKGQLTEAIRLLSVVYEVHNNGHQLSGGEEDDVCKMLEGE